MKRHKRDIAQRKAALDIDNAIFEASKKHDLTDWELVAILTSTLQTATKYALRFERHGDDQKPGGLE